MTILDKSNYFKGLLLLARKDNIIAKQEKELLLQVGKSLSFEENFCHEAINYILDNEYISNEPPVFSSVEVAQSFIRDGIRLALSDENLSPYEIEWLQAVAEKNSLSSEWLNDELRKYITDEQEDYDSPALELNSLLQSA